MIVGCVCTRMCHTEEHKEWSPAVPCAWSSCTHSQPIPRSGEGAVGWRGLLSTVHRQMQSNETWKDCDDPADKGLGVLLHRSPAADRSTQLLVNGRSGKEEAEGNVKWKPDATASH